MTATTLAKKVEGVLAGSTATAKSERRRELDRIGPLVVMGLVVVHTLTIFAGRDIIVDPSRSELTALVAGSLVSFLLLWAMPLMMFIAGMTVRYSLRKRTVGEFVWERFKRLLVPFCTGLVLAIPPMAFFKAKQVSAYAESFLAFYPRFWQVRFSLSAFPLFFESATPDLPFFVTHLWFLLYLFVYTLLLLPLLLALRSRAGRDVVKRLAETLSRPWAIFILALPIALIEAILTTEWPGAWNRFVWPFLILYGFLVSGDSRLGQALVQHRRRALILGIVGFGLYYGGIGYMNMATEADFWSDMGLVGLSVRFFKGAASWFWLVAIMGAVTNRGRHTSTHRPEEAHRARTEPAQSTATNAQAARSSRFDRAIAYVREGQVPLYVIHKTPLVVFGYYVVQWNVNPVVKFAVIALSSFLVTLLVYEFVIRRLAVTRVLFGMKPRR